MEEPFSLVSFSMGLVIGSVIGIGGMFLADRGDLLAQDKIIANLEAEAKFKPVITIDALGICKVTTGGKSFMLIDVTEELRGIEEIDESYRATEQEIAAEEQSK